MCFKLKPIKVYKVLNADFTSPVVHVKWPKTGIFRSGRKTGLTQDEIWSGMVHEGLHFYNKVKYAFVEQAQIIVKCTTKSIIARNEYESVALDCEVEEIVCGADLVDIFEAYGWTADPVLGVLGFTSLHNALRSVGRGDEYWKLIGVLI